MIFFCGSGNHRPELSYGVDHRPGPGAPGQPAEDVEGEVGGAPSPCLHVLDDLRHGVAKTARAHRKQEAPEAALLAASGVDSEAGQDLAPGLTIADPGLQVREGVQVVDDAEEIGLSDQHLAALGQLHGMAEYGPAGIVVHKGFRVGIDEQVVEGDPSGLLVAQVAVLELSERRKDAPPGSAKSDQQVVHRSSRPKRILQPRT